MLNRTVNDVVIYCMGSMVVQVLRPHEVSTSLPIRSLLDPLSSFLSPVRSAAYSHTLFFSIETCGYDAAEYICGMYYVPPNICVGSKSGY